MKIRTN